MVSSASFESFFIRRSSSESTSATRRKLHSAFLRNQNTRSCGKAAELTYLLHADDSVVGYSDDKLVVDPYSSPNASLVQDHRIYTQQFDAELVQRLELPMLAIELSLPPTSASFASTGSNNAVSSLPSSPKGEEEDHFGKDCVRLRSNLFQTQQALARSIPVSKAREDRRENPSTSNAETEQPDMELQEANEEKLNREVDDLREQMAQSQTDLQAMKARSGSSISKMEGPEMYLLQKASAIEVKLLEKAEECERLSSQVTSLAEQLEKQMGLVADLEQHLATPFGYKNATFGSNEREYKLGMDQLRAERDEYGAQVLQLTQQLAVRSLQIYDLEAKTARPMPCQSSSSSVASVSTNDIDVPIRNNEAKPPGRRNPGNTKAKDIFRTLLTKKGFSFSSPKEGNIPPFAAIKERGQEATIESRTTATDCRAGIDSMLPGHEYDDTRDRESKVGSSLDCSASTSEAAIHALMQKIDSLEKENERLKCALGGGINPKI